MKITAISAQVRDPNRVNVSVDGQYRFSLDIFQLVEIGVKVGQDCSEEEILELEKAGQLGKLYARALEYTMIRPHSAKEVRDYLWRKTRDRKVRSRSTGEIIEQKGVPQDIADAVFERLVSKGYIDDVKFARYWVENRDQRKGISRRKLESELRNKGVGQVIISDVIQNSSRGEKSELQKTIEKKRTRYPDERKFNQYLIRQGFSYDDILQALRHQDD